MVLRDGGLDRSVDIRPRHLVALRDSRLGQFVGTETLSALAGRGHVEEWTKNSILFWEDDKPKGIYVVLSGSVKLIRQRADGRELLLHMAHASDVIAEGAVFLGRNPATAVTTTAGELFLLQTQDVLALLETEPRFARYAYSAMAAWLDRLVTKIDQLTLDDATARLSRYLLDLAKSCKCDTVDLPLKKGDLALLLNMNQATLSRTLRRLQDDGHITVDGRTLSIADAEALDRLTLPPLD